MWLRIVKIALIILVVQPESVAAKGKLDCARVCEKLPESKQSDCVSSWCTSCAGQGIACVSDLAKKDKAKEVEQGAEKAKKARTACKDGSSTERKQCFKLEGDKLPKPGTDATEEERRKQYANLKKYQDGVDDSERERKKEQMKSTLFDKIKKASPKDAVEKAKRDMCDACIEGIDETEAGSGKVDGIEKKFVQKMCVEKCVKQTLLDVEASDLKACYENAGTDQDKKACFCSAKDDDVVRKKISDAGEAGKTKGVMEFMCRSFIKCSEGDEVDCEEKMSKLLSMAKGQCSGKQQIRSKLSQLKQMCRKKQIDQAYRQCKEALGSTTKGKNVRQCVEASTGLKKGKVEKLRQDALKKEFREQMITCKRCSALNAEVGSANDCPDPAKCQSIIKAALFKELGSKCEGNFKALVENAFQSAVQAATSEDELIDVAKNACEIIIRFKKGKGKCRPDGRMRPELKKKLAKDGLNVDGVMAMPDDTDVSQIEIDEDGEPIQEATMKIPVVANAEPEPELEWMTAKERIEQRCDRLVARWLNRRDGDRRLADLEETDIEDVTGAQATETCLASDLTCQSLGSDDDDDDDGDDDNDGDDGAMSTTEAAISMTDANSTTIIDATINNARSSGLSTLVASIFMNIMDLA